MAQISVNKRIHASLPTIGYFESTFYAETARVVDAFGFLKEFARLRKNPHLGLANQSTTGVNHSRLEYTLLLCASVTLTAKLFKGTADHIGLSAKVKIPGRDKTISSGQELLRCWALLSGIGHLHLTYGQERAFLLAAMKNESIQKYFVNSSRNTKVRGWIRSVICDGRDDLFHYVIAYWRISQLPQHDRDKAFCEKLLNSLTLPIDSLFPSNPNAKFKLSRLRAMFGALRTLSMISIDSFYSAQPIRFDLSHALLDLPRIFPEIGEPSSETDQMIAASGAWIADSVYLSKGVVRVRRPYEVIACRKILQRWSGNENRRKQIVQDALHRPVVQPSSSHFQHLFRITLKSAIQNKLVGGNLFVDAERLHQNLGAPEHLITSIEKNPFSGNHHVDLLVNRKENASSRWRLLAKATTVFLRQVEVQARQEYRKLVPAQVRRKIAPTVKRRMYQRVLGGHLHSFPQLFNAVMLDLLPEDWRYEIECEGGYAKSTKSVAARLSFSDGEVFDNAKPYFEYQLTTNPHNLSNEALHELSATSSQLKKAKEGIILVCLGSIKVRDSGDQARDELDGVIIKINGDKMIVLIVEAKCTAGARHSANEAYRQLEQTRSWVKQTNPKLSCRRKKIPGVGATMSITAP